MTGTPTTYRGGDARIKIWTRLAGTDGTAYTHTQLGVGDFSITFDRGTVEQELVGETGNYHAAGTLSIEGSLTATKLEPAGAGQIIISQVSGTLLRISGSCGANSLSFYFASCQTTSFDLSMGDSDTVTDGSFDFVVLNPSIVTISSTDTNGIYISDAGAAKT